MRNRDEPAGAYTTAIYRDEDRPVEFVGGAEGLTKRQAAAIAMAQANRIANPTWDQISVARQAARDADALFNELERDDAKW